MKTRSHAGFWVVTLLMSLFLTPVFWTSQEIRGRLNSEIRTVHTVFGTAISNKMIQGANSLFGYVRRTGIEELLPEESSSTKRGSLEKVADGVLSSAAEDYVGGLLAQVYSAIMRAIIVLAWIGMLMPMIFAAALDGFCQRKVKLTTLGAQMPTASSIGSHAVIGLSALPLIYVVCPLEMNPLFMPVWALATCLPLGLAISHMQPIFSRR